MTRDEARHLLRRLAFVPTPAAEEALLGVRREEGASRLVDAARVAALPALPDSVTTPWRNGAIRTTGVSAPEFERVAAMQAEADERATVQLRQWWIEQMVTTPVPIREVLVLMLHDAIGISRPAVQIPHALAVTNQLLRAHALDTVPALLERLIVDPGMQIQIGMDEHTRIRVSDRPAKLVLDRWTVGPGSYTDADVEELSRALTGWRLEAAPGTPTPEAIDPTAPLSARRTGLVPTFDESRFDRGTKTILGAEARFGARAAMGHLARHPATARRYATLLANAAGVDAGPRAIDRLAAVYRESDGSLAAMLTELTRTDEFWAERKRWTMIKSPVQLAIGACRQLAISPVPADGIVTWLGNVGQTLFDTPANGEGRWARQEEWITAETLTQRYQLPRVLAGDTVSAGVTAPPPGGTASRMIPIPDSLRRSDARSRLLAQLDPAPPVDVPKAGANGALQAEDIIRVIMMSPNYQLA